jgi:hypothetical protein
VPAAANLTNGTGGSEIAINITDGRLYYKDNNGAVQLIGAKLNSVLAAALASAPVGTGNVVLAAGTVGTGNVVLSSSAIVSAGGAAYSSNTTLTAANAGQIIFFTGTAASTFTLPSASALPAYTMKLTISNAGTAPLTIAPASGDGMDLPSAVLYSGQQAIVVNDGVNNWHVIAQNNGTTLPFAVGAAQTSTQAVNLGQAQADFAALAGSTTQAFSVANATTATQAVARQQVVGAGATAYVNTGKVAGTIYTNTTGRPLYVSIEFSTGSSGGSALLTDGGGLSPYYGTVQSAVSVSTFMVLNGLIPIGATYKVSIYGTGSYLGAWYEY